MLVQADARALPLRDACVQCVVTSPPYWGLRDYGTAIWTGGDPACRHVQRMARQDVTPEALARRAAQYGTGQSSGSFVPAIQFRDACRTCGAQRQDRQIGLEPTPEAYVATLVQVFREVWRVLKADGTVWLNLGSSYFGAAGGDTHTGFNERYFGKQFATNKQATVPFPCDGKPANQSRQRRRAHAYGTDGTALQDSTGADSACRDLCDECLADWMTHCERIADISRPPPPVEPLLLPTSRDSALTDCASASLDALLPGAQASNTLESWQQHRGECSRCDRRASALSGVRSSSGDAHAFARMTWLDYTRRLKHKDMVPVPWMVAMALQADGWYLRSDIIWHKPNPMPESVTDRPTKAHEYLFLLTKAARYYYDADAIKEPQTAGSLARWTEGARRVNGAKSDARTGKDTSFTTSGFLPDGRNRRSVWTIATQSYPGAHFATMPEALIEPCILAGSKPGDVVLDPFGGTATVVRVARRLNREGIACDLNPQYLALAEDRITEVQPSLLHVGA